MVLVMLFFLVPFLVMSLTGGIAGAIQARGSEDRALLANAGIGLVGWVAAWMIVTAINGRTPVEATIGLGVLALVCSVGFLYLMDRRRARTTYLAK